METDLLAFCIVVVVLLGVIGAMRVAYCDLEQDLEAHQEQTLIDWAEAYRIDDFLDAFGPWSPGVSRLEKVARACNKAPARPATTPPCAPAATPAA